MNMMKMFKCLKCIVKCNKWLYFIRKMLCTSAAVVVIGAVILCYSGNLKSMKYCMKKWKERLL